MSPFPPRQSVFPQIHVAVPGFPQHCSQAARLDSPKALVLTLKLLSSSFILLQDKPLNYVILGPSLMYMKIFPECGPRSRLVNLQGECGLFLGLRDYIKGTVRGLMFSLKGSLLGLAPVNPGPCRTGLKNPPCGRDISEVIRRRSLKAAGFSTSKKKKGWILLWDFLEWFEEIYF